MIKNCLAIVLLAMPIVSQAACPRSLAGKYVGYGNKTGPTASSARALMVTVGPISEGFGTITVGRAVFNEIGSGGNTLSGEIEPGGGSVRYTYDGNCFGYAWEPHEADASKLQISFFFVSDSGAQLVMLDGPKVQRDSAGNPVLPLPSNWQQNENDAGLVIFRKQ